jgi:hypothetical protein
MANGFCRRGPACREIDAERHAVRHSRNSVDTSLKISPLCRVFFATPNDMLGVRMPRFGQLTGE